MSRPSFASCSHRLLAWSIAFACVTAAGHSPAHAGLGDLMKKAKEKVTQATTPQSSPATTATAPEGKVVFDDVTLELTPERLDHILASFKAASDAGSGRPALVEKLNKATDDRGKVLEKNEQAIMEARQKRDDVEVCYHDGYREAMNRATEDYTKRALTDPAIRDKFTKAAAQYNAAAAKGDSTAIAKLNQILTETVGATPEDSANVRKKCGPKPPRLAAEDKLDDLDKQIASLNDQIRAIDDRVAEAQAKQGGLSRQQWAMAMERLQMYLQATKGSGNGGGGGGGRKGKANSGAGSGSGSTSSGSGSVQAPKGFSQVELDAIEKRLQQLRAYMG